MLGRVAQAALRVAMGSAVRAPAVPRSGRPVTERGCRQIGVMVPRATLAIIEREAALCGLKRSVFLHTLLLHHLGRLRLERRPGAPSYRFPREDWTLTERYV